MAAPSTVLTNGVTQTAIGTLTDVADEIYTSGTTVTTLLAVEDFSFEPKRTHKETMDADEAIVMRKSVTPQAVITLKGVAKSLANGLTSKCPGTSITTTVSGGSLALANFASTINGFGPTDGLIILDSIKFSRKRLTPRLDCDCQLTHLPHAA
jgi:hypothetical protein